MRFEISRASAPVVSDNPPVPTATRDGNEWYVEIGTLEELLGLDTEGVGLIVTHRGGPGPFVFSAEKQEVTGSIVIYDHYVE